MKRICILLACLAMLMLASCSLFGDGSSGGSNSALDIYNKIDEEMNSVSSYKVETQGEMVFEYMGADFNYEITGTTVEIKTQGSEFYYDVIHYDISSTAAGVNNEATAFDAYYNGKAFVQTDMDDFSQMLYSEMTYEQYKEYLDRDDDEFDLFDCSKKQKKTAEDGTKMLVFSGYSKMAITDVSKTLGSAFELFGFDVLDINVTITYDDSYRCTSEIIEFIFDDEQMKFALRAEYGSFNSASVFGVENLDESDFTYVENLKLLKDIEDYIDDIVSNENGEFALSLRQELSAGTQSSAYGETDNVSYGKKNGKFYYDIASNYAGTEIHISYENGTRTVKSGGKTQTQSQSEAEAKYYIENMINTCGYQRQGVTEITQNGSVITIKCYPSNVSSMENVFLNSGGSMTSVENTIVITLDGDKIVKIESNAIARGRARVGAAMYNATYTLHSELVVK